MDLFSEDVGVTGVPGDFGDHAQIDESQAHGADKVMGDKIVELVIGGQFVATSTCRRVFSDHVGECLVSGDPEATLTACGVTIAFVDADGCQCSFQPDAFCCTTMLDQ